MTMGLHFYRIRGAARAHESAASPLYRVASLPGFIYAHIAMLFRDGVVRFLMGE